MANFFLNIGAGNGTTSGTTFANAASALSQFAIGGGGIPANGDTIRCQETVPYDTGLQATVTKQSISVTLSNGASTSVIYSDGAWTGATNVTATTDAVNKKEGSNSSSLSVAAAFTTGQIGFFATGTLDLSKFQKISFWIKPSIVTAANTLRLDLCSDTAGATPVNSYTINFALAANTWTLITTPDQGALGSSIKSVNLQALLDPGTNIILLDIIIACLSGNNINQSSVIGFNDGYWFPIKSINGTALVLDNGIASLQGAGRGYWNKNFMTGTKELWAINPIALPIVSSTDTNTTPFTNASIAAGVTLSGAWNTTDMTTQMASGYTLLDRRDAQNLYPGTANTPKTLDHIGFVRAGGSNINTWTNGQIIEPSSATFAMNASAVWTNIIQQLPQQGNTNGSVTTGANFLTLTNCECYGGDFIGWGMFTGGNPSIGTVYTGCLGINCNGGGFQSAGTQDGYLQKLINCTAFDNATSGFITNKSCLCFNLTASGNTSGSIGANNNQGCRIYGLTTTDSVGFNNTGTYYVKNWSSNNNATKVSLNTSTLPITVFSTEENGVIGQNNIYSSTFTISSTGAGTYTGSGLAWIGIPLSTTANTSTNSPARVSVGTFPVNSGETFSAVYNVARNNVAKIMGRLIIFGGIQGGIGSYGNDVITYTTPPAWANNPPLQADYVPYTITAGPATENGVVQVWFEWWTATDATGRIMIDGPVVPTQVP